MAQKEVEVQAPARDRREWIKFEMIEKLNSGILPFHDY